MGGGSDGSVSDPCYLACKVVMDAFTTYEDQEVDQCKNGAHDAVLTCLKEAHAECIKMPWVTVRTCASDSSRRRGKALVAGLKRALEEDEDEAATVVPMGTDGVTDLSRATPKFQAAVAQSLGLEMPKVTLNVTRELLQRRRLPWYSTSMPNCKTHWCGECPNIPKNKKGQPSGTAVSKGGRC